MFICGQGIDSAFGASHSNDFSRVRKDYVYQVCCYSLYDALVCGFNEHGRADKWVMQEPCCQIYLRRRTLA